MSKVDELVQKLHIALQNNVYKVGGRFPSEYDLMNQYDVARQTANKATSILVSEGLLERRGRGGGTVVKAQQVFPAGYFAFISSPHPFSMQIYNGLAQAALERNMLVFQASPGIEDLSGFFQMMKSSRCGGVFSCSYGLLPVDCQLPWIDIDGCLPVAANSPCHVVRSDCYGVAREMILAIGKKYRNIVTVTAPITLSRYERQNGFNDGLEQLNIPDREDRQFICRHNSTVAYRQVVQKIMQRFPEVEFIATDSDDILSGIFAELRKLGIDVPGRINLSGFGNINAISQMNCFASVEQHPREMGAAAMDAMMEILKAPDWRQTPLIDIKVPATLVGVEYL